MFKSPARPKLLKLAMLPFFAIPAACAHPIATAETKPAAVCSVWKPVIYSRLHDTAETIAQVKALNAAHDALCGAS